MHPSLPIGSRETELNSLALGGADTPHTSHQWSCVSVLDVASITVTEALAGCGTGHDGQCCPLGGRGAMVYFSHAPGLPGGPAHAAWH